MNKISAIQAGNRAKEPDGSQGTGMTTSLKSHIAHTPPEWAPRVLELASELHLKENYLNRKIIIAPQEDLSNE